ncbi:MAG: Ribosomal protein S12 methylthiotransferase RimO [Chloroflexi bacterium]|nr:Ribosomal protein S12 methylthiotransferase RimO [Chloroflexota bacterium]
MFLPTTQAEVRARGWTTLDVILITGDTYIDSPYIGVAIVGKVLVEAGFRVGIIAQPDARTGGDVTRLGEPELFWGVTGGSIDSLVANFTATKKRRRQGDYTPGGVNNRRPDRAVITYTNLIKRFFKDTVPIVLGGLEASLRRITHYDYWSNKLRRSILFDAKADYLLYGMAEKAVVDLAQALKYHGNIEGIPGLCYISQEIPGGYLELPSYQTVKEDKHAFIDMFHTFYENNDPRTARGLAQKQDTRYLIQNPPAPYLTQDELDAVYALDYERDVHPYYKSQGEVRALETIGTSVATHRGCYGECNFCAIAMHEGRTVRWRSQDSVVAEVEHIAQQPGFTGYLRDVSGPTANMYGFECEKKLERGVCNHKRCVFPEICPQLPVDHGPQRELLQRLREVPGVKKVFVASGLRYDMLMEDVAHGEAYLRDVVRHHVSGQMKVAPEHTDPQVLEAMGKPGPDDLIEFRRRFFRATEAAGKEQYLTYYLIAAHPGCTEEEMRRVKQFASRELHIHPEQVQIFTPTPSTYSSLMYYTEMDPWTREPLFVEKEIGKKIRQKRIVTR